MEKKRDMAFKSQDYEMLKSLVQDLKIVFEVRMAGVKGVDRQRHSEVEKGA
jgi:hypothetical protein